MTTPETPMVENRTAEHSGTNVGYVLNPQDITHLIVLSQNANFCIRSPDKILQKELEILARMDLDPKLCAEKYYAQLRKTFLEGYIPINGKKCSRCEAHNQWHSMDHCYMQRAKYASPKK